LVTKYLKVFKNIIPDLPSLVAPYDPPVFEPNVLKTIW